MDLPYLVIIVVVLAAITILVGGASKKHSPSTGEADGPWPFYAKRVLSKPEQVLYHRLVEALPDRVVLAQVQLSRFLGVQKGKNFHAWNNRINRMSADFVICSKDSSVIAVIELDDSSHARKSRQDADVKKDKAIAAANLRLIRWKTSSMPNAGQIRQELG